MTTISLPIYGTYATNIDSPFSPVSATSVNALEVRVHGGVKVYRGTAVAARMYVEADRSRADDYYLTEGTGIAQRFHATGNGHVVELASMDGDAYEGWVAGADPDTGEPRGRLRTDEHGVRFVEVTVNGPKSWSLAAELHPDVATAY